MEQSELRIQSHKIETGMWRTHSLWNLREARYLASHSSYKEERDIDGPTSSLKLAGHSQKETHLCRVEAE